MKYCEKGRKSRLEFAKARPGHILVFFSLLIFAGVVPVYAQQALPDGLIYPTAVVDFQATEVNLKDTVTKVNALLTPFLSTQPSLSLVERAELEKALSEQELGITGTVDTNTAAKIGNLTGAKVIVSGKVFTVGNQLFVVAKIIGVETSRVYGETESCMLQDSPAAAIEKLAGKIAATIIKQGVTLVAKEENREDVVAFLKKALQGKKLPVVTVSISERSLGGASFDPAAQTEIILILKQLGFEVVEPDKTATTPDIEISGEAFSEFGMRKGNLISSKGRLELKAVERTSGRILAVDRRTEVAVDLSEQIAGKTALQKAAQGIVATFVPQLVK